MNENQVPATTQGSSVPAIGGPRPASFLAADVIVPRLLLMQGTSEFIRDRVKSPDGTLVNIGDVVKSTTFDIIAGPEKMADFIPLSGPATGWRVEKRAVGAQRWEFHAREARTALNDGLPWKFTADKDGKLLAEGAPSSHEWRRLKTLSLFALLPQDIAASREEMAKAQAGELPDLSKALSPVMIEFRSTSFQAGKEVATFFSQVEQFKATAWKYTLKLGCFMDKNDQGTFYVFKVDRNKPTPVDKSYLSDVEFWANIVSANGASLKVDEEKDDSEVTTSGNF
jgi:hypothetical protein